MVAATLKQISKLPEAAQPLLAQAKGPQAERLRDIQELGIELAKTVESEIATGITGAASNAAKAAKPVIFEYEIPRNAAFQISQKKPGVTEAEVAASAASYLSKHLSEKGFASQYTSLGDTSELVCGYYLHVAVTTGANLTEATRKLLKAKLPPQ